MEDHRVISLSLSHAIPLKLRLLFLLYCINVKCKAEGEGLECKTERIIGPSTNAHGCKTRARESKLLELRSR